MSQVRHQVARTTSRLVRIGPKQLEGFLTVPEHATGLIIFAHGSGSSRRSPRNAFVAEALQLRGMATLLFDLLTEEEALDRRNVFDVPLLASRLEEAVAWARTDAEVGTLKAGFFGASTGSAAALVAATEIPEHVAGIVSRGGRPDLAGPLLHKVSAPTLLIVGGDDNVVLDLNRDALARLNCEKNLLVVPGATHLFEEPGTLDQVARAASDWFALHLRPKQ
jgi:putative phosphoribosyl transferase